jgi:hypothetical protein
LRGGERCIRDSLGFSLQARRIGRDLHDMLRAMSSSVGIDDRQSLNLGCRRRLQQAIGFKRGNRMLDSEIDTDVDVARQKARDGFD